MFDVDSMNYPGHVVNGGSSHSQHGAQEAGNGYQGMVEPSFT